MSDVLSTVAAESLLRESEQRRRADDLERDALRLAMRVSHLKSAHEQADRVARIALDFAPPKVAAALRLELDRCAEEVKS